MELLGQFARLRYEGAQGVEDRVAARGEGGIAQQGGAAKGKFRRRKAAEVPGAAVVIAVAGIAAEGKGWRVSAIERIGRGEVLLDPREGRFDARVEYAVGALLAPGVEYGKNHRHVERLGT